MQGCRDEVDSGWLLGIWVQHAAVAAAVQLARSCAFAFVLLVLVRVPTTVL